MLEMIPLGRLGLSPDNPRRQGAGDLTGLKASICADGILQNLVVYPAPEIQAGEPAYFVAAGGRRFRAMVELHGEGKLALDYLVPCRIEDSFDRAKALAENVHREPMHPVDEFEAFNAVAIEHGIPEVMNRFGVSERYVMQRMKIGDLTKNVRKALKAGEISMSEAFAIALLPKSKHAALVNQCIESKPDLTATLKRMAFESKIPVERAIFDLALYTGKYTTDLFPEEGTSGRYFADKEKFFKEQRFAAIKHCTEIAEAEGYGGARFGDETGNIGDSLEWVPYGSRNDKASQVLVFWVDHTGAIQRRGNAYYDEETTQRRRNERAKKETEIKVQNRATKKEIKAQAMEKYAVDANFSMNQRALIAGHRTSALQFALADNTEVALRWAVFCLLVKMHEVKIVEHTIDCGREVPCCHRELGVFSTKLRKVLRINEKKADVAIWQGLCKLDKDELLQAFAMLVAPSIGYHANDYADEKLVEELIGQELEVEVEKHWRPDEEFLSHMTREQLTAMVEDTLGPDAAKYLLAGKKSEAVARLAKLHKDPMKMRRHEIGATGNELVDEERRQAFACWLPKGMSFFERTESEIIRASKPKKHKPLPIQPEGEPLDDELEEGEDIGLPDVPETGEVYPMAAE